MKPSIRLFLLLILFLFSNYSPINAHSFRHSVGYAPKKTFTQQEDQDNVQAAQRIFTIDSDKPSAYKGRPVRLVYVKDNESDDEDPDSFEKNKNDRPVSAGYIDCLSCKTYYTSSLSCPDGYLQHCLSLYQPCSYCPSYKWHILLQVFRI